MCGIFGRVGELAVGGAEAANRVLRHRGPDAEGIWRTDDAELAHRRLSIVDLSPDARQPMTNEDGTVWLVFNGEIYNFLELRPWLEQRGHRFRSRSDSEVIIHLYEERGPACIEELDGMFALGLYDTRNRTLLLARDRAGKKPLFYAHVPGKGLCFASETKALFAAGLEPVVDEAALAPLMVYGYVPAPMTSYRGIQSLPPASKLTYELPGDRLEVRRYWSTSFARGNAAEQQGKRFDPDAAAAELRHLVEAAVKRRLISDVPLGAFLSGGLDSTVVVGLMARHLGRPVRTFSIGMAGDPRFDETQYARMAARAFQTDHTEFYLEPASFDLVEKLVWHHDGPFGDSSAVPTYMVSKLTREHVTVALTGDGGDEIFGGYMRFVAGIWSEMIPPLLFQLGERLTTFLPKGQDRTLTSRASRFFRAARRPLADRLLTWNSHFAFDPGILLPDAPGRAVWEEALAFQRDLFVAREAGATPLARMLDHNFAAYLPYDLLIKTDRTSMAVSLEARCPLLDTKLIEFCATAVPDRARIQGLTTKWLFRRAFADSVPPDIMTRKKAGFGMPLATWTRGPLKQYMAELLLDPACRLNTYLDRRRVRTYFDEHMAGRADHGHQLWLLLTLEVWLRQLPGLRTRAAEPLAA